MFQSQDGTYAMKKVLIQSKEQLDLVKEEIRVSSLFNHPNLFPLLDHAIITVKVIYFAFFFSLHVHSDAIRNWTLRCQTMCKIY